MMEEQTTPARAQTQRSGPVRLSTINEKVQVASGDLNAASQSADSPHTKTIEPLEITRILPFAAIPDFKTPTASAHPIILKTPSQGCFCIDGPELVEEARQQNRQCILCEIIHARSDSDIDIALHKAAVRSMPPGGTCSYVEMVGNTVRLFGMLMDSGQNLETFSHGGARRGTSFTSRRDQDAIAVLEDRLGRKRKTILKQLEHGAYLNEEAQKALVEADVPKGFFEAMQQGKTALVAELKTARRPVADIINAVSAKMIFWLTQAQTPVPIEISSIEDSQAVQTTREKASRGSRTSKPRKFTHWAGNELAKAENPLNEDRVRGEMRRIATDLLQLSEDSDLAKTAQVEAVRSLTVQLSKLTAHLVHLSTRDGACRGGTV
jgi:hypothetical protein